LNGRRLLLSDVVDAHVAAIKCEHESVLVLNLGNEVALSRDQNLSCAAEEELSKSYPFLRALVQQKGWEIPHSVDRVYDASETFVRLAWKPKWTPAAIANLLLQEQEVKW
jgi:UDP-glucose 4-epimerase